MYKWLIWNSMTAFIAVYLVQYYGALNWLLANDPTHISIIISVIYVFVSGYIGYGTLRSINKKNVDFASHQLMGLGLIGTVIGMMLIFGSLDTTNIKEVIPKLMHGIATAQITTLFGLGSAFLISVQSFFVGGGDER